MAKINVRTKMTMDEFSDRFSFNVSMKNGTIFVDVNFIRPYLSMLETSSFVRVCPLGLDLPLVKLHECAASNGRRRSERDSSVEHGGQRGWKRFYVAVVRSTRALGDQ